MRIVKEFALGLVILAVLVAAAIGIQVVPTVLAPAPTPDPATLPEATLSPAELSELVRLAQAFDGTAAMVHVRELSAERYDGRRAGTPGADRAAGYIEARFREVGLQPAGLGGTYFQQFRIDYLDLLDTPALEILDRDGSVQQVFSHHEDFREVVGGWRGDGTAQGEMVYLGNASAVDWNKIDVDGRVVLCHPTNLALATEQAANRGAVALLSVTGDEHDIHLKGGYYPWVAGRAIPTLKVSARTANQLLRAAGRSLDSASTVGEPFSTGVLVRASVPLAPPGTATARNVLGLIPGASPARADEVVILGAHYDHVGRDPAGTLYPGAIDDASGVAVLLEIARLWHEQGFQPQVSVLFAAWDAEEAGLLGSRYYVEHPRFPLAKTVAMIQLDSVSGSGDVVAVTQTSGALSQALLESARRLNVRMGMVNYEGSSDHVPFNETGVPAVMLIWSDAWSLFHVSTDTPDGVRVDCLRQTGLVTNMTLMRLASGEEL